MVVARSERITPKCQETQRFLAFANDWIDHVKNALQLALKIETPIQGELRGIEMGVSPDGAAFLSQRGVAEICGVVPSTVTELAQEFARGVNTPRAVRLRSLLEHLGWNGPLYTPIQANNGQTIHAYPDAVVVAFLQYYAFDSRSPSEKAMRALGLLATKTLRDMIYVALGLPVGGVDASWNALHERMLMNEIPAGWFSVFSATQHLLVAAKRGGLNIGPQTVPDISIGQRWSAWWTQRELARKYGDRRSWPHRYPSDHPQARANGYIEAFIYPKSAMGEFAMWLDTEYLPVLFPKYLDGQIAKKSISSSEAYSLVKSLTPKQLPAPPPPDGRKTVPVLKRAIRRRPPKK